MKLSDINNTCKSSIFKSVLSDLIYSFRMSIKKMTGATADVRLDRIKVSPINTGGDVIVSKVKSLIGGKVACSFDKHMIDFLNIHSDAGSNKYSSEVNFAIDFFDNFSSISRNGILEMNTVDIETLKDWLYDSSYFIRFDTRIITKDGKTIPSKFVISIDEIASMYFKD